MRPIHFALLLLVFATSASAQELTLSEPADTKVCANQAVEFSLTATGTFEKDNSFVLQSSTDGFKTFTNLGAFDASKKIRLQLPQAQGLRFRAISSNPFVLGASTVTPMDVFAVPKGPMLYLFPWKALQDKSIEFGYFDAQPGSGEHFEWHIPDGTRTVTKGTKFNLTFNSPGKKLVSLVVSNDGGCSDTSRAEFNVYTCDARIPKSVHIVTGSELEGKYEFVWVKPGGKYTMGSNNGYYVPVVYMEPGSSLFTEGEPTIYAKPGASIEGDGRSGYPAVLQNGGVSIVPENMSVKFDCPDMQFDYSEVQSSVDEEQLQSDLKMRVEDGQLHLDVAGNFTAKLIDVMGRTMIDAQPMIESGTLDMRSLTRGTYFVLITRGQTTIAKQIQR